MASQPRSGNTGARSQQLPGPFVVLRFFPSRFPEVAPAAPSTWQLRQGSNKLLESTDSISFVSKVYPIQQLVQPVHLFCVSFCVESRRATFCRVSRSSVHNGNIFFPQSGLFLYRISRFGLVPICRGEVLLNSTLNWFIGKQSSWGKPNLVGISSFVG